MRLILFICEPHSPQEEMKQYLPDDYVLLQKNPDQAGLQAVKELVAGLVLVDAANPGSAAWLEKARVLRPDLAFIGTAEKKEQVSPETGELLDALLYAPYHFRETTRVLKREWERARMAFQLQALQKGVGSGSSAGRGEAAEQQPGVRRRVDRAFSPCASPRSKEQLLGEFSKALSSSFNRDRLLELFLDTVNKLAPVGRLSIVLQGDIPGKYRVYTQQGLPAGLCARLCFRLEGGLMGWLADQGRILLRDEAASLAEGGDSEVAQELKLLQAAVSVPLQAHGYLWGALNLGQKVTGVPFTEEELEMLFILSGNVAMALRDIDLHHQVLYQKAYIENILQRMNSGVVAINSEEKITTCNRRATEVLGFERMKKKSPGKEAPRTAKAEEKAENPLVGKDLRGLPSPLGDILYETMRTGKEYQKEEHQLAGSQTYLEISTNQLVSEEGKVLGSVMIFEDISARKQLEQEKSHADRLDVLNRFVGQLAHEIKNPMVAIQTFTELLPEKYEDSAFREFFNHTVRQEVKRLNELVEQLIAFSSPLSYRYTVAEAHELLDMGLSLLREQGKGENTTVETSYFNGEAHFKADKALLPRALSYLLGSSFEALEKGGKLYIETRPDRDHFPEGGLRMLFWDGQTRAQKDRVENLFDPLAVQQGDYISLELPVSKKIIEDHGGTLKTSIKNGGYLAFEVSLPTISPEGSDGIEQQS